MHFDLTQTIPVFEVPDRYQLMAWSDKLINQHALAKYQSFRNELDANVFPCLGDYDGCHRLMKDISNSEGFVVEATWLIIFHPSPKGNPVSCATIQGIRDSTGIGTLQNVGVVPEHRGCGLAKVLLSAALHGFRSRGITTASLEVTSENQAALDLYLKFGFRISKTVFKAVDIVYSP
ncbi:MAG TPA: GNAT family N-acetyltransferase [Pirellulaceae bacterium]|nr:GNAT family N-acetyltransferase [Pirellulaceae bacterium]HMP69464.1 GNAT family N-acetyltransferase [Pirellulaceae bacterium]